MIHARYTAQRLIERFRYHRPMIYRGYVKSVSSPNQNEKRTAYIAIDTMHGLSRAITITVGPGQTLRTGDNVMLTNIGSPSLAIWSVEAIGAIASMDNNNVNGSVIQQDDNYVNIIGRLEGPHIGQVSYGSRINLQAVDTANVPFFSVGSENYRLNSGWIAIGYTDQPHIRMRPNTDEELDIEQHRPVEVDAGCIVGSLPAATISLGDDGRTPAERIGQIMISLDGETMSAASPLTDIGGWLIDENSGLLLVVDTP